jgi:hypothetical protein
MQKEDEERYIYAMQSALTPTQKPKRLLSSIIDKGLTSWRESKSKMDA